ncbi:hypothetical protein CVT24_001320 [Panaeolus cyanescens]|uniref:Autophagy-related protein 27 n=1 Tax=Panaeolus cyanescens TaxID=181874 RepID=A0A409VU09_9AGAR|nr:hypothetical protein CVT24_001320 [Panaeolus cyanescens]
MSRASTSFIFTSFLLAWQWAAARGETTTHTLTDEEFSPSRCSFRIHDYDYNLCPLMETTATVEERVFSPESVDRGEGSSSSVVRRFYEVALGGGMRKSHTHPALRLSGSYTTEGTCDDNTMLCITEITRTTSSVEVQRSTRPNVAMRSKATPAVKRKNGKMKSSFSLSVDHSNVFPPVSSLEINLLAEDEKQSVHLEMICSDGEVLNFIREHNGEFSFAWNTPHACPSRVSQQSVHALEDGTPEGENAEPEKEGDQKLLPPQNNHRLRFWISVTLVIVLFGAGSLYAFLSSPRLRNTASEHLHAVSYTLLPLISQASTSLKPLKRSLNSLAPKSVARLGSRFRQGDSQLVRWAQEDMALEDAEDFMVNGNDAFSGHRGNAWDEEGLDEYIPLTMGTKHGRPRSVRSYGATPEVETFAERGISGGLGRIFGKK